MAFKVPNFVAVSVRPTGTELAAVRIVDGCVGQRSDDDRPWLWRATGGTVKMVGMKNLAAELELFIGEDIVVAHGTSAQELLARSSKELGAVQWVNTLKMAVVLLPALSRHGLDDLRKSLVLAGDAKHENQVAQDAIDTARVFVTLLKVPGKMDAHAKARLRNQLANDFDATAAIIRDAAGLNGG